MIEKFLLLKDCIKLALSELNSLHLWFELNIEKLEEIVEVLKPVEIAVKKLSKDNSNLITGEAVLHFVLEKLYSYNSELSNKLAERIIKRAADRRNKNVISLLFYL
jgi:hypothetical protein